MSNLLRSFAGVVAMCVLIPCLSPAQESGATVSVPRMVSYSATANDLNGKPLTGPLGVTFALYKDQTGGAPVWIETQTVQADSKGHYSATLGVTQPNGLPTDVFTSTEARWLGVQIEGQAEQPRTLLLSVPYALKAGDAQTIGGLPPSAFVMATPSTSGSALSSAAESTTTLTSASAPPPLAGSGTVNFVPLWTPDGNTLGNSVVFQSGTGSTAKIGVNSNTPTTTLDVKGAVTIRGLLALPATGTATATAGKNSQAVKMTASAFNSSNNTAVNQNFQWQAEAANNNTGSPSGTMNLLYSSGSAAPAETGLKISNSGVFTFADGQTFPGTGTITSVTAGTALTGGGTNGNITLSVDTTQIPQLNLANTFTANQTVNGNLSATGTLTGSSFQIGSNLFAYGNYVSANAFLGFSGNAATTGLFNTGNGALALSLNTSGSGNTANGYQALGGNTTGGGNTATGASALQNNTTGINNTATGGSALQSNTTGAANTADGVTALQNSTGSFNTATGNAALVMNTTGNNNTASGANALLNLTTGSNNTALGMSAGPDPSHPDLNNSTAIGANAQVTASNALVLGSINGVNGATADTFVGIGTTAPAAKLDVHGTANFTGLVTFAPGQSFPGAGTITGVTAGTALTGGGTNGGVTLNVDTTKVVTGVVAGTGLTGGGTGGVPTISVDTTKTPQLAVANTFTGNQTVNGNMSATGVVSGSSFNIGSNLFAYGSFANYNAFLGFAGNSTSTGSANTGVGEFALAAVTSASGNTAVGEQSLWTNTTGPNNTAIGAAALQSNTTGSSNTATGWSSLSANVTGGYNTGTGIQALASNTGGSFNTATGDAALAANTTGNNNTATGNIALRYNSTGSYNTATGDSALENTTVSYNTADGYSALKADTTGAYNTATGYVALTADTTGSFNTAAGFYSLSSNSTGSGNTAFGSQTLTAASGSNNTAIGSGSLYKLGSGDNNTTVGNGTFYWLLGGSNNTAIGNNAGTLNIGQTSLTNATAIGAFAEVEANNSMVLGSINGRNGATADTNVGIGTTTPGYRLHIGVSNNSFRVEGPATAGTGSPAASFGGYGDFGIDAPGFPAGRFLVKESGQVGIGTASPDALLSVNGSADKPGGGSWGTFSDGRLKNLHGEFNAGLREILKMQPVRYSYKPENGMGIRDSGEHIGFVAQDVQKVIPEAVSKNDKGYLLINNDPILWTMLNAIKEQQREIRNLRAQLKEKAIHQANLEARLSRLERNEQVRSSVAVVASKPISALTKR